MPSDFSLQPLTPIRTMIASRMTEAKQTIPHYRLSIDILVDPLISLRKTLNDQRPWQDINLSKLSINDFIIKAAASALMEVPAINVQWVNGAIHQYHHADISIVTAIEGGLTTPIIVAADTKTVVDIAGEARSLSSRAKSGRLKLSEISGGTFSVSNLGMFGIKQFDAIINPPQVGMLAIGSANAEVCAIDGEMKIATVMRTSLSLDHRVIDGAQGAAFLAAFKRIIECADQSQFF